MATTKGTEELSYWRGCLEREGVLQNSWYHGFYTVHFGLSDDFYAGKRILDIGCGPRGSLEWADMTALRVGLDAIADDYRALGADRQKMIYLQAVAEAIPFPADHFDVVCSFNSLDHVDDLDAAIREIMRVLAPGGLFLLLTDLHDEPTVCEPSTFSWDIVARCAPPLEVLDERHYEKGERGMYTSITDAVPFDHNDARQRYGVLSVKFRKPR